MRLSPGELTRQTIHIAAGLWAFGLRWLGPVPLMVLALGAVLFNAWALPRVGGRRLWRPREHAVDRAIGILLYPLAVLLLLVVFYRRPEVAAAGWGLLAFGDGAASLIGQAWGGRRLPWNPAKSWAGLVAYWIVGWPAVAVLVAWTVPGRYGVVFLVSIAAAVALLGALLESAPQRLDDNLAVPLVASLALLCLLWTEGAWGALSNALFLRGLLMGLVVSAALASLARALAVLDLSGAVTGCCLGTVVFAFLGWPGFLVLFAFVFQGALATRWGYRRKAARRLAQEGGGKRRAANALANGAVAAACALFAALTPFESVFVLAFVGSLAAAAADTVESEIGQLWGHPTVLITTLRPVAPGTDGGVSPLGTLAGLLAAILTVGVAWAGGLCAASAVVPLALLALLATLCESLLGATLERQGLLDNDGVNFLNTLMGAGLGALLGLR